MCLCFVYVCVCVLVRLNLLDCYTMLQVSDQNSQLQEQVAQIEAKLSFAEQEKLRIQKVHMLRL